MYSGPAKATEAYFKDLGYLPSPMENPADFFLEGLVGRMGTNGDEGALRQGH